MVCRYSPAGNLISAFPENIKPPCPQDSLSRPSKPINTTNDGIDLNSQDDVIIPTSANVVCDAPTLNLEFEQETSDELNKINNERNLNIGVNTNFNIGKFNFRSPK